MFLYFTVLLSACKNKGGNNQNLSADKIDTNPVKTHLATQPTINLDSFTRLELPYSFKFLSKFPDAYTDKMDSFLVAHRMSINRNASANSLFSNSTEDFLLPEVGGYLYPSDEKAYLIGQFPFVKDSLLLLLFYYNYQSDACITNRFELQVFKRGNNTLMSKLIVGDLSSCEDCFIRREFSIDKNFRINILSHSGCFDEETQKSDEKRGKYVFSVTENGIIERKNE
jgi:hypothetical protein